ncbi:MAG: hypothetical protein R2873_16245 [Caldilineaceae bacterium]
MTTTIRVKGIYNGKTIELLEAVTMPPDTVEVLVPELEPTRKERLQQQIQDLVDKGVLTHAAMDRPRDLTFIRSPFKQTSIGNHHRRKTLMSIFYVDSSAIVKLYVNEAGSVWMRKLFRSETTEMLATSAIS